MANAQIPIQQIESPSWSAATTTAAAVITITNQNQHQHQHQHHQTVDTTRETLRFLLLFCFCLDERYHGSWTIVGTQTRPTQSSRGQPQRPHDISFY